MPDGSRPFDLHALSRRIEEARKERKLTMRALASQVGVSASTIRRFGTADDAEADGVLALVAWLGDPPEMFIAGSTIEGTPLPPAGGGQIRVDLSRLDEPGTRSRTATRTTIQRLTAAAGAAGCSVASLTRWSEV